MDRTVAVVVEASVAGLVGLPRVDEATGCMLDFSTVLLDNVAVDAGLPPVSTAMSSLQLSYDAATLPHLHPSVVAAHAFVSVEAGKHTVTASFQQSCTPRMSAAGAAGGAAAINSTAAATSVATGMHARRPVANAVDSSSGKGLPSVPPFPPAVYSGSWTTDATTRGNWIGKYGADGYQLFGR